MTPFRRRRRRSQADSRGEHGATFPLCVAGAGYLCLLLEKGGVAVTDEIAGNAGEAFTRWYFGAEGPQRADFLEAGRADPEDLDSVHARRIAELCTIRAHERA